MQPRGPGRPAGQNETVEGLQLLVQPVDGFLQPLGLRCSHTQTLPGFFTRRRRHAEVSADIEEIVLDGTEKYTFGAVRAIREDEADHRVQFIDLPKSLHARRVLRHARAIAKASFAL